jgi:hypothetical protein
MGRAGVSFSFSTKDGEHEKIHVPWCMAVPMKQSLLTSLVGMPVETAKLSVMTAGHMVIVVPDGVAISLEARPNTVILWEKDDIVSSVTAGDPLHVEADVGVDELP